MRNAGRRRALLLTVALVATGAGLAPSPSLAANGCPDPAQSCVVVTVVSMKDFKTTPQTPLTYTVPVSDIAMWSDTTGRTFRVRDEAGKKAKPVKPAITNALSMRGLLTKIAETRPELADLADKVTFSEASDDGVPRVLDKPAFGQADPANEDFPFDDALPPVVYPMSGGRIGYFRPLTGEDDVNRADRIVLQGRLDLVIHTTGKLLKPTATVSNSAPTTKDKPAFEVSFSPNAGTALEYEWDFGDGRSSKKKSPKHRYTKRDTYNAFVSIRGADGSYGRSDVVTIKVAKPPKPPKVVNPGTGGSGTGSTGGTGAGGYVPPYVAPVPSLPDPIDDLPQDEPLNDEPADDVPVDDGLVDVEGYVLAGAEIVPGGTLESIPGTEASAAVPVDQTSVRSRIATWTIAALAIALLVGAGAASETRWLRNRLRPLRRRA